MKTASRHLVLAIWLLFFGVSIGPLSAWADPAMANLPPATNAQTPEIKLPDLPKPLSGDKKDTKNADSADIKVPDSVKEVIKHLNNKNEDITLDDLNAAREAVAKLDALIDIEKRLADLDKIREERNKAGEKKLAEAIPKAALMPPPSYTPPPVFEKKPEPKEIQALPPPPPAPPPDVDIIRIEGSNNHYGALVKDGGGLRLVHAGDKLSDGTAIISVTTRGIELERNKITHLAQIKDVQAVFGNSP